MVVLVLFESAVCIIDLGHLGYNFSTISNYENNDQETVLTEDFEENERSVSVE